MPPGTAPVFSYALQQAMQQEEVSQQQDEETSRRKDTRGEEHHGGGLWAGECWNCAHARQHDTPSSPREGFRM
jgi:hypothetical protein